MDVDAIDIGKAYEQTGYMITKVQLTAYGICPNCQEKLRAAGEPFMAYRKRNKRRCLNIFFLYQKAPAKLGFISFIQF